MQDKLNEKITSLKKELEQLSFKDNAAKDHINELIKEIENTSGTA